MTTNRPTKLLLLLLIGSPGCAEDDGHSAGAHDPHADEAAQTPDAAAHEGEEILQLDEAQVLAAGIAVQAAGPGPIESVLELTAIVGENQDAQAHVTPRVPGLVRTIFGRLGQEVKAGDPLCEIESIVFGQAVGVFRKAGATLVNSEQALRQEKDLLERAVELAEKVYAREMDLAKQEITTVRFLYDAEKELQEARLRRDRRLLELQGNIEADRVDFEASRTQLRILGLDDEALDALAGLPAGTEGRYTIQAPRDGVIVARHITEGEFVDAETELFELQDLSTVWVLASVYEQDLARVREGAAATVRLNAFPEVVFHGSVDFIDFHVDGSTRSAAVRVLVDNRPIDAWQEDYPVRPGLFGQVTITTDSRQAAILIPEAAVVHEGAQDLVFVRTGAGRFEARQVDLAADPNGGAQVEVLAGIEAGEEVVVTGTFTLKSYARKGELGEGHEH